MSLECKQKPNLLMTQSVPLCVSGTQMPPAGHRLASSTVFQWKHSVLFNLRMYLVFLHLVKWNASPLGAQKRCKQKNCGVLGRQKGKGMNFGDIQAGATILVLQLMGSGATGTNVDICATRTSSGKLGWWILLSENGSEERNLYLYNKSCSIAGPWQCYVNVRYKLTK